jgi:Fe-S cluster assembly protein SufB
MTQWRLDAYRHFLTMPMPDWAKLEIAPIDLQALSYYSAPKGPKYASLDEVPKELLDTYDKLGVPLHERAKLAGVAVDAVFDSVSVGTTFRKELAEKGVIFCSMSEAIRNTRSWCASTWAPWCRWATTTSPRSTRRCSPTAASCSFPRACAARWS